jgi:O-antigen/teichoic acid export membrane protein
MSLREHAASLMIMHAADVIQPLLILPYAARVLGPAAFGQYVYTLALTQLASIAVDYGFSMTARRTVASVRNDPEAVGRLLAEVTVAKGILCSIVAVVTLLVMSISQTIDGAMAFSVMLAALGGTLFPLWLFLGLERSWHAAIPVVLARAVALVAFLLLVKSPADAELAASIQASITLVSAAISLPLVIPIGFAGFASLRLRNVVAQFRRGWSGCVSWVTFSASVALPVPILEHFSGISAVAQYSVAEKLVMAVRPIFRIISQTLMPRIGYLAVHNPAEGLALIWASLGTLVIGISVSAILYIVGPPIIILLFGPEYSGATSLIRILCFFPFFINVSLCMSDLYMFNFGHEKAWMRLTVAGFIVFLAISYALSIFFDGPTAVAIGSVSGEAFIALISTGFFVSAAWGRRRNANISGAA